MPKSESRSQPVTKAGKDYLEALTIWLQETRLLSEAAHMLYVAHKKDKEITFSPSSWPKSKQGEDAPVFNIGKSALAARIGSLQKELWNNRFVFLESLWEEYLQKLILELKHKDSSIFEPFCEKEFMADIVREVLSDKITSIEAIKDEAASRFSAGLTRQPWEQQWKQLSRLSIGLSDKDKELTWFKHLDIFFEMRNCIIHRQCKPTPSLIKKDAFFKSSTEIEIWPNHLDFYRHHFISCLLHIEQKILSKYGATNG